MLKTDEIKLAVIGLGVMWDFLLPLSLERKFQLLGLK